MREIVINQPMSNSREIVAVDLFCGAGGLTYGLRRGGVRVAAGVDIDPTSRFAYEANNPGTKFVLKKVENIQKADLEELWEGASERLLAGCAPCQPFSTYSQGKALDQDSRWRLLDEFARLIRETLPEHVTMENVPSLKKNAVFLDFCNALEELEYRVWHDVVDCSELGLPQARKRLVLLASRIAEVKPLGTVSGVKSRSVRKAFERLPSLNAGGVDEKDSVHRCANLNAKNLRRIQASLPGGSWKDWPTKLRCKCHQRKSGDGYLAVYGRMEWDALAPTITTQCYNYGSGRFGHPSQDRAISLREAAILQGFPRNYRFEASEANIPTRDLSRLIGNAVPPPLGTAIAKTLRKLPTNYG